jgi:hypothetical protein
LLYDYNYNISDYNFIVKSLNVLDFRKKLLLDLFINNFPTKFQAAKTKTALKKGKVFYTLKNTKTFLKNEYLYYNKFTCNFLVVDIDTKEKGIREIIEILDEYFIQAPTWICETDGGYQVGFNLEKPFLIYPEKKMSEKDKILSRYAKNMLYNLHTLLNGDPNSFRLTGFYKNPINRDLKKYKLFATTNKFNLSDFDIILPAKKTKIKNYGGDFHKEKEKVKFLAEEFLLNYNLDILKKMEKGYRNSFIWYCGMYLSKHSEDWIDKLKTYNLNLNEPLDSEELTHIIKSIKNYNRSGKNFVMGYKSLTKDEKKEYMKEYRIKKGIHKKTREQQKEENKTKVLQAVYALRSYGEKLTIRKIAEVAKLSKNVVNKYVKELKEDPRFKVLF